MRLDDFDREDSDPHLGEDGGLVPGSRADFEDAITGLHLRELGHESDDVRLADRLPIPNGKRSIIIGAGALCLGHEEVARHFAHGA